MICLMVRLPVGEAELASYFCSRQPQWCILAHAQQRGPNAPHSKRERRYMEWSAAIVAQFLGLQQKARRWRRRAFHISRGMSYEIRDASSISRTR